MLYNLSQQRKFTKNFPYSYPFYRIYHLSYILAITRSGNSLCGEKMLELGFVIDKETEDFHSELPSRIAVLLAISDCSHGMKAETTVCFVILEDRLHFL
jgi:hypothetical protein